MVEPQLSSWITDKAESYARIFTSKENESAGLTSTTWSRGQRIQNLPTSASIHQLQYTDSWMYIKTFGLGLPKMGPLYLSVSIDMNFPSYLGNTVTTYTFLNVNDLIIHSIGVYKR